MIFDSIKNIDAYAPLCRRFPSAFDFLRRGDTASLADGEYPIDGRSVFAIVQTYRPKAASACRWEAHEKYIDIQYIVSGTEAMGIAPIETMRIESPYDSAKDVTFFDGESRAEFRVASGFFATFFPRDVHRPGMRVGHDGSAVKKIVVKVAVE